jgi:hypothetical protein
LFYLDINKHFLDSSQDILYNLRSLGIATKVRAQELAILQVTVNGLVDESSSLLLVQELQHESDTSQSGDWVGDVLTHDVWSGTVTWLTDGETLTNVGRRDETEGTDKGSGTVREDITVKVRSDNDVVGFWLTEELVDHRVDNLLLNTNAAEGWSSQGFTSGGAEESISLREDVGLVGDGHKGAFVDGRGTRFADLLAAESNLTGHGSDTVGSAEGNTLDGLGDLAAAIWGVKGTLILDVEVLGVLTDNDHVDWVLGGHDRLHWTHVGVEVETLAKGDNWGRVALDGGGWGRDSTEESSIALVFENLDGLVWKGGTGLLKGLESGIEVGEFEFEAEGSWEGFKDAATSRNDFLADTITWDETFCLVSTDYSMALMLVLVFN